MLENHMVIGVDAYYEAQEAAYERSRPICQCCGEKIYDRECYRFGTDLICKDCFEDFFKKVRAVLPQYAFIADCVEGEIEMGDAYIDTPMVEE